MEKARERLEKWDDKKQPLLMDWKKLWVHLICSLHFVTIELDQNFSGFVLFFLSFYSVVSGDWIVGYWFLIFCLGDQISRWNLNFKVMFGFRKIWEKKKKKKGREEN